LRDFAVVSKKLLRVLGETIAAVTEAWIVVMVSDHRIETNTIYNLFGIQAIAGSTSIQLIELAYPHGAICIDEKFDRLCFGANGEQS
jgi:hypothetical protein